MKAPKTVSKIFIIFFNISHLTRPKNHAAHLYLKLNQYYKLPIYLFNEANLLDKESIFI